MALPVGMRVEKRREALRAMGLRPVQLWLPDVRQPGFAEECARQAQLTAEADRRDTDLDALLDDILDDLEVLGVDKFEESAVHIVARIKTRPIRQWTIGREFNRRMKLRFDELGIVFPLPRREIEVAPGNKALPDASPATG